MAPEAFDPELLNDFVHESREHLDAIEPELLALEHATGAVAPDAINKIFRAIHSIKGGAGFLSFERLKRLSHSMENVFMVVRDGQLGMSPELADVLLRGVDKLRVMLDDVQTSDSVPCEEEMAQLDAILKAQSGNEPDGGTETPPPDPATQPMEFLQHFRMKPGDISAKHVRSRFLYHVEVNISADLRKQRVTPAEFFERLAPLGDCLGATVDFNSWSKIQEAPKGWKRADLLFSTVLEPDLVAMAIEMPEERVTHLDAALFTGEPAPPTMNDVPPDTLGRILIEKFNVKTADVLAVVRLQASGDKRNLGSILIEMNAVTADIIVAALKVQEKMRLGTAPEAAPAEKAAAANVQTQETLRVRLDLLTRLMNSAGELVLARNQLLRALESGDAHHDGLSSIVQNIDHVTSELQEGIMQTRMQPIGTLFSRFSRVVRDTGKKLGKEIELTVRGGDVELDKSILEVLSDPLTHLVRNSADHGVEAPAARRSVGKPAQGNIELAASHEGGQVHITIRDDGAGIDPAKVLRKAVSNGLVNDAAAAQLSRAEILKLIFRPGFSTAEQISDVSGRGVGMDVVKTNIEKLGGTVSIESEIGSGTTILLQLPLTLAIIPSIVIRAGEQRFAIPQLSVVEFVWIGASDVKTSIERFHGQDVLRLRGRLLPLVDLASLLHIERRVQLPEAGEPIKDRRQNVADRRSLHEPPEASGQPHEAHSRGKDRRSDLRNVYNIVVVKLGKHQFGLIADELHDTEEIVVKALPDFLKRTRCFSGTTILGDGQVILILDVAGVGSLAKLQFNELASEQKRRLDEIAQREKDEQQHRRAVVITGRGEDERVAFLQDNLVRLERVPADRLQRIGGREMIEYLGEGMPILRIEEVLPIQVQPPRDNFYYVLIPKTGQKNSRPPAGILVSDIVDAREVTARLSPATMAQPGLMGSAIVDGRITLFVDPAELAVAAGAYA